MSTSLASTGPPSLSSLPTEILLEIFDALTLDDCYPTRLVQLSLLALLSRSFQHPAQKVLNRNLYFSCPAKAEEWINSRVLLLDDYQHHLAKGNGGRADGDGFEQEFGPEKVTLDNCQRGGLEGFGIKVLNECQGEKLKSLSLRGFWKLDSDILYSFPGPYLPPQGCKLTRDAGLKSLSLSTNFVARPHSDYPPPSVPFRLQTLSLEFHRREIPSSLLSSILSSSRHSLRHLTLGQISNHYSLEPTEIEDIFFTHFPLLGKKLVSLSINLRGFPRDESFLPGLKCCRSLKRLTIDLERERFMGGRWCEQIHQLLEENWGELELLRIPLLRGGEFIDDERMEGLLAMCRARGVVVRMLDGVVEAK